MLLVLLPNQNKKKAFVPLFHQLSGEKNKASLSRLVLRASGTCSVMNVRLYLPLLLIRACLVMLSSSSPWDVPPPPFVRGLTTQAEF